ncbi:unnamed protein product, partial [Symbiodinium necroappetens]
TTPLGTGATTTPVAHGTTTAAETVTPLLAAAARLRHGMPGAKASPVEPGIGDGNVKLELPKAVVTMMSMSRWRQMKHPQAIRSLLQCQWQWPQLLQPPRLHRQWLWKLHRHGRQPSRRLMPFPHARSVCQRRGGLWPSATAALA